MARILLYAVLIYGVFMLFRYFLKRMGNQSKEADRIRHKEKIDASKVEDADFEEIK